MGIVTKTFIAAFVALAAVLTVITLAFSREREAPRSADVSDLKCRFDSAAGVVQISATIVNSADEARDYEVLVEFLTTGGTRVGTEQLVARAAKPGQKVQVQTRGTFVAGSNPKRCEVA